MSKFFLLKNHFCLCAKESFGMVHKLEWHTKLANLANLEWHTKFNVPFQMGNCLVSLVFSLHLSDHRLNRRAFPVTKEITKARLNLSM
jgi:hypothetical protein